MLKQEMKIAQKTKDLEELELKLNKLNLEIETLSRSLEDVYSV